jgi:hypothetical protein
MISFQVRAFAHQKNWLGQLREKFAFFVEKMSKEVLIAEKRDVSIKTHGKVLLSKTLKAKVRIGEQSWEAVISPESFDRFRDWKFAEDEDEPDRADESDDEEREPQTGIRGKADREDEKPRSNVKRKPRPEDED